MFYSSMQQLKMSLVALRGILSKAEAYAAERKFDANNFLGQRVAPDMYPLTRQFQFASDTAKFAAARLTGKEAPKFEDTETTTEQLHERLQKTIDYLDTFTEADFAESAHRKIVLGFMPHVHFEGSDYLAQFVMPNFYFHVSMAYALLRSAGVPVGKQDYLGTHLNLKPNA